MKKSKKIKPVTPQIPALEGMTPLGFLPVVSESVPAVPANPTINREQWLTMLTDKLRPMFEVAGELIPIKIRLTCGWPSKKAFSSKNRRVGECWDATASKDQHVEVFVSPCVSDGLEVAGILAHELIHACGHKKHGKSFKRVALAIGLEGKMTATTTGPVLKDRLNGLISDMPVYPHAVLDQSLSPKKKDGTRMLKVICTGPGCGYTVRTTQKWVDVGLPTCTCGQRMGLAEGEPEIEQESEGE